MKKSFSHGCNHVKGLYLYHNRTFDFASVSYTHLDVYKRQALLGDIKTSEFIRAFSEIKAKVECL